MRLKISIDNKTVGDYPQELMQIPENMVKILKNHLHDNFNEFKMSWYDENKTKQIEKKINP